MVVVMMMTRLMMMLRSMLMMESNSSVVAVALVGSCSLICHSRLEKYTLRESEKYTTRLQYQRKTNVVAATF